MEHLSFSLQGINLEILKSIIASKRSIDAKTLREKKVISNEAQK